MRATLKKIDEWLELTGLPESRLGLLSCANPRAIARIRSGSATLATLAKVEDYLDRIDHGRMAVVYFAYSPVGNLIKIGYSRNPDVRVKAFRENPGLNTTVVATIPGNRDTERALHKKFVQYQVGYEWFDFRGDLKKYVMRLPRKNNFLPMPQTTFKKEMLEAIVRGDYAPIRYGNKGPIPRGKLL